MTGRVVAGDPRKTECGAKRFLPRFVVRAAPFALMFLVAAAFGSSAWSVHLLDIAPSAGLTIPNTSGSLDTKQYILEMTGNGAAIFDYDGDGANDIFIANGTTFDRPRGAGLRTAQLYHNDGTGHFTDVSRAAGFTTEGWGQGVCVGDYNNDGHPDLMVTHYGHNILYRNTGAGAFEDVTAKAGLPVTGTRWGSGCAFLDYDRDGLLDLFVANYVDLDLRTTPKPGANPFCEWLGVAVACGPRGLPMAHNVLYHNNGDGTFTDVSARSGILKPGGRYGLGVAAADFDNDGWPDIYVACDQTPSLLYYNRHDGTFEERGVEAGVAYNADGELQSGMGAAVADYDGNGFLDIAKTNFSGDLPSLYKNENGKFFTDVSLAAGLGANHLLGWGIAFVDLDQDGWKDLILANGHFYPEVDRAMLGEKYRQKTLLYRNLGNDHFADVTAQSGPGLVSPRPSRGLAVGDLDGDGTPEIVIVNMNEPPSLLKNTGPRGHAIRIQLVGTKSNRSAIGARVELTAGGRTQIGEVQSGGSYFSQNDLTLHFGLGAAPVADSIKVRWPSGTIQDWKRLAADATLTLTEGATRISRRAFKPEAAEGRMIK
ncbi:MAG: CRTAC1 family protein [Bryobacteraceae bacterium]